MYCNLIMWFIFNLQRKNKQLEIHLNFFFNEGTCLSYVGKNRRRHECLAPLVACCWLPTLLRYDFSKLGLVAT